MTCQTIGAANLSIPCSWFRCKFGTPLRRIVALLRLFEREGYPILGTTVFVVDENGVGVVRKGDQPRTMAPELRRLTKNKQPATAASKRLSVFCDGRLTQYGSNGGPCRFSRRAL